MIDELTNGPMDAEQRIQTENALIGAYQYIRPEDEWSKILGAMITADGDTIGLTTEPAEHDDVPQELRQQAYESSKDKSIVGWDDD